MGRPWLVPAIAAVQAFGAHYWVLRLTGAVSGVLLVWASVSPGRVPI